MTTLYETIFIRRQVRKYVNIPLLEGIPESIERCAVQAEHLAGQHGTFKIVPAVEVSVNHGASHFLLGYCDDTFAAYANVGFVLQKADLYAQSIGLGSGWFMDIKPISNAERFCIALAIGKTEIPIRKGETDFKRKPLAAICDKDSLTAQAVRLAPSSMNSQPWKLEQTPGMAVIRDAGRGISRLILKNKLNKIDIGIATRHAVLALEHQGKEIEAIIPKTENDSFSIEILYQ